MKPIDKISDMFEKSETWHLLHSYSDQKFCRFNFFFYLVNELNQIDELQNMCWQINLVNYFSVP